MEEIFTSSWGHWISFNYFARYENGEVRINEEEKHGEIAWFLLDKIPPMSPYGKKAIEEYERKYI
jgi:ADP-ribose pyrophosphatase YjhB (NUDIX family)